MFTDNILAAVDVTDVTQLKHRLDQAIDSVCGSAVYGGFMFVCMDTLLIF